MLFGTISLLGGHLEGFSPEESTSWRIVFILVALAAVLWPRRQRSELKATAARVVGRPRLALTVVVMSAIVGLQLWVFMWGPANGHAQDVAFGYFLLPLVMVLVGRVFFRDRLNRWQWAAVVAAGVGVLAQLLIAGGIGWPVGVIALLYPVYFGVRRWAGIDAMPFFLVETVILLVPAVAIIAASFIRGHPDGIPGTWPVLLIMVALSGVAMTLYILAARLLPLSMFGLLSYLEPVLVLVAAVLLGEPLTIVDAAVYAPIVVALILLGLSGARRDEHAEEPPL